MIEIMIVDDKKNILKALLHVLQPLGYSVESFTSPKSALARAHEKRFDLVITDYKMPVMDGIDMMRKLRHIQPEIAAIMLSGYADVRFMMDAINEARIDRFLTKPFDNSKLKEIIREVLHQKKKPTAKKTISRTAPKEKVAKGALAKLEEKYPGITQPGNKWGER